MQFAVSPGCKIGTKNSQFELLHRFLWRFSPCHNPRLHSTTVRHCSIGLHHGYCREVNLVCSCFFKAHTERGGEKGEGLTWRERKEGFGLKNKRNVLVILTHVAITRGNWPSRAYPALHGVNRHTQTHKHALMLELSHKLTSSFVLCSSASLFSLPCARCLSSSSVTVSHTDRHLKKHSHHNHANPLISAVQGEL